MAKDGKLNELLEEERSMLVSRIAAIDILLGSRITDINQPPVKDVSDIETKDKADIIPSNYDSHLVWEDKCLFVLNERKSAYAANIVEDILEYEPDMDKKKKENLANAVSQALVKLKKADKIKIVETTGRKFRYSIK